MYIVMKMKYIVTVILIYLKLFYVRAGKLFRTKYINIEHLIS